MFSPRFPYTSDSEHTAGGSNEKNALLFSEIFPTPVTPGWERMRLSQMELNYRDDGGWTPGRCAVESGVGDEKKRRIVGQNDRRLFNQIGRLMTVQDLPGGTHPGTEHRPMRCFLMMRMMGLMRDRLRGGQPADDKNTEH
jgi:hypothetical protein